MKQVLFAYPVRNTILRISMFENFGWSLKANTDFETDNYQMITRFSENGYEVLNCGISHMHYRSMRILSYNLGSFFEKSFNKFNHRIHSKNTKAIKDL